MFMLDLWPMVVLHDRTDTSSSTREIASDYCCWSMIDLVSSDGLPLNKSHFPGGERNIHVVLACTSR